MAVEMLSIKLGNSGSEQLFCFTMRLVGGQSYPLLCQEWDSDELSSTLAPE